MNSLRFGSFGAQSAPSRLWSNRVEADDPEERELPPVLPHTASSPTVLESHRVDPAIQDSQGCRLPLASGAGGGQEVTIPSPITTVSGQLGDGRGLEVRPIFSPQGSSGQPGSVHRQEASTVPSPTSSPRSFIGLGGRGAMEQVAPRSVSPTILAGVAHEAAPIPSSPATRDGRLCGEHSPRERTTEELISFSGIPGPVASGRRVSNRIQEQPDADDLQLARAKRAAMLRDVEATTGMSFDKSCSIMHFFEHEIMDKANNLGITLGSMKKR